MQNPRGLLMQRKTVVKFDEVLDRVHSLHDRNFEDKVVDLAKVKVLPDGNEKVPGIYLDVPEMGRLTLTDWSKRQIGSILGIKFDKWFDPTVVKAEEIQEELVRRFSRTHESRKIRARKFDAKDPGSKYADGFCRAVLSPTYSPIDDVRIFDRMSKRFRGQMNDIGFLKNHLGTDFYNDRASHYTVVGEPVNMGPIDRKHPDPRVRHIYDLAEKEGALPAEDWVYQGYHLRNSEVGYTAVIIDDFAFRLVCLNGAIISVRDGRLLYRVHRSLDDEAIDGLLDGAFRKMPVAWEKNRKMMVALRDQVLEDPEAEILKFLNRLKATKAYQDAVKEAYEAEPLPNRYGVMQALSRAAQKEPDMDRRVELEEMAGQYMALAA
jgi:hypothetical protein